MSATSVECAPMHAPGRGCALALVAVFGTLAGCVELPVPTRTPYAAAPRSSSTPWSPPPAVTAQRPRTLAARETRIDPQAVYGLADLIDFAHRTNPETHRAWEEARAGARLARIRDGGGGGRGRPSATRPGHAARSPPRTTGASPRRIRGGGRAGRRERRGGRPGRQPRHSADLAHARRRSLRRAAPH